MLALYGVQIGIIARASISAGIRGPAGSAEFRNAFNQEADPSPRRAILRDYYAPWLARAAAERTLAAAAGGALTVFFMPHCCARAAM